MQKKIFFLCFILSPSLLAAPLTHITKTGFELGSKVIQYPQKKWWQFSFFSTPSPFYLFSENDEWMAQEIGTYQNTSKKKYRLFRICTQGHCYIIYGDFNGYKIWIASEETILESFSDQLKKKELTLEEVLQKKEVIYALENLLALIVIKRDSCYKKSIKFDRWDFFMLPTRSSIGFFHYFCFTLKSCQACRVPQEVLLMAAAIVKYNDPRNAFYGKKLKAASFFCK